MSAPYSAVIDDTGVHPSTLNVIVYIASHHTASYVSAHAPIVVAFVNISSVLEFFHHLKSYPAFDGPAITGIFAPYTTFSSSTTSFPSLYVTLYVSLVYSYSTTFSLNHPALILIVCVDAGLLYPDFATNDGVTVSSVFTFSVTAFSTTSYHPSNLSYLCFTTYHCADGITVPYNVVSAVIPSYPYNVVFPASVYHHAK
jgi:hypothetical protein